MADGVEVEESMFDEFTQDRSAVGLLRIAGNDGLPEWGEIPSTHQEQLLLAENEKQNLIDRANAYMNSWQWSGKAVIGRLKGDELMSYNKWLDYLEALEMIDAASYEKIEWPDMLS